MTEPEGWQVSTDAAEVYESCFVPAIFGAWAGRLLTPLESERVTESSTLAADGRAAQRVIRRGFRVP